MTGHSIIGRFRLRIATHIFQQSSTASTCGSTSANDSLIAFTRLIVSFPDGGSSKAFIQENAMSEYSIWHVVSCFILQHSDLNYSRKASSTSQAHTTNLNKPLVLQSGEATEAVLDWQASARLKISTQTAAFTVLPNNAMPKRKITWWQSSPAISEDQLDFEIYAADHVRLQLNPTNCASIHRYTLAVHC